MKHRIVSTVRGIALDAEVEHSTFFGLISYQRSYRAYNLERMGLKRGVLELEWHKTHCIGAFVFPLDVVDPKLNTQLSEALREYMKSNKI